MLFSANDRAIYTEHVTGCQQYMKAEQTALKAKYKSFVTGLLRGNGHIRPLRGNDIVPRRAGARQPAPKQNLMRTNITICLDDGIFDGIFHAHTHRDLAAKRLIRSDASDAAPPISNH